MTDLSSDKGCISELYWTFQCSGCSEGCQGLDLVNAWVGGHVPIHSHSPRRDGPQPLWLYHGIFGLYLWALEWWGERRQLPQSVCGRRDPDWTRWGGLWRLLPIEKRAGWEGASASPVSLGRFRQLGQNLVNPIMPINIPKSTNSTRNRFYEPSPNANNDNPQYIGARNIPTLIFLEVCGCFLLRVFDAVDA